jgi:hypothetical protein
MIRCPRCNRFYFIGDGYKVPMCDCPEVQEDNKIVARRLIREDLYQLRGVIFVILLIVLYFSIMLLSGST